MLVGDGFAMRSWLDNFREGSGNGTGQLSGYNVELSFAVAEDVDMELQEDRISRVAAELRRIASADDRLQDWRILPTGNSSWLHIHAVVSAHQPGTVAELSEKWMRQAIDAANHRLPSIPQARQYHQESRWHQYAISTVRAQVRADT